MQVFCTGLAQPAVQPTAACAARLACSVQHASEPTKDHGSALQLLQPSRLARTPVHAASAQRPQQPSVPALIIELLARPPLSTTSVPLRAAKYRPRGIPWDRPTWSALSS